MAYLVSRLLSTLPVLIVVSFVAFALLQLLPGDPVESLLPALSDNSITPQEREAIRQDIRTRYGLDAPLPVQYFKWVGLLLRGQMGNSISTGQPVTTMLRDRAPVTFQIGIMALVFGTLVAIPAGILAAIKRNSFADLVVSACTTSGIAIPNFFLGMLLLLLFSFRLQWLPPPGNFVTLLENPTRSLQLSILPALTLGGSVAAFQARLIRSSMLEALAQDYVRTARAKGLGPGSVVVRHALRNALMPAITVFGLQVISVLSGSVIIEQMFAIPGLGRMAIAAIRSSDSPVVLGFVLFAGVVVVVVNLAVDVLYGLADPRLRTR